MRRLRWQLTISHLIAIAFTLVCMMAALAFLASGWWGGNNAAQRPVSLARYAAQVVADVPASDMGAIVRVVANGQLRQSNDFGPQQRFGPATDDVLYVAVVDRDGQLVASSMSPLPAASQGWRELAQQAMQQRDGVAGANGLGAAAIVGRDGQVTGAALVQVPDRPAQGASLWPLAFFGVATVAVLVAASVFALVASTIIGYFLSRRLVGRLEQLGQAADELRGGNLSARVPEVGSDEVSQLQRTFNSMAGDLERSMVELADERDRVSGLLEARRQLVAGVSHELRTPIATVRGYLESALRRNGDLPSEVRVDLGTADREVTRLEGLIDDLFTLSRAEVGRLDLRLAPTDVGALVRGHVQTQAPLAWRQRQVQIVAEVPASGPMGLVDARRVTQIVSNLLSNAVRHTPPGGLVAATVSAVDAGVRLEIRDTGAGIAAEVLPKVFERFYQADGGHGAGLGLALVKELAESMHGCVDATSTLGEGSCFAVTLPAV